MNDDCFPILNDLMKGLGAHGKKSGAMALTGTIRSGEAAGLHQHLDGSL